MAGTKRTCTLDGCDNPHEARGWCELHYARWKRHGDPTVVLVNPDATCSIKGCDKKVKSKGLCNLHYRRQLRNGDPLKALRYRTIEEAFESNITNDGDCIIWTGLKNQSGYGRIKVKGRFESVHRYAWELAHGPIPDGMQIDHKCWNRACVNVDHLRLATHSENKRNAQSARVDSELGIRNIRRDANGYIARVQKDKKRISKYFANLDDAIAWENAKRVEMFGDFAGSLNPAA